MTSIIGQPLLSRRDRLNRYGYYTDENIFSPELLGRIRAAADRLQREGVPEYTRAYQDYYPNVIEFDDAFAEILDNPVLLAGLNEVIDPDVQLYANEVLVSKGTNEALAWHRDKMSIGRHCPNMFLKVCIYLDAYKGPEFYPYKIDYLAGPGSLLAFGANTMHRAGLHAAGSPPRPALFFVFIPWWIKQATYYAGNECVHLLDSATPMRLQLPGVKLREGIAMDSFTSA